MKRLIILIFLASCILHLTPLHAKPITYIWDMSELVALASKPSSQEYKDLIAKANGYVKSKPTCVTNKTICISGDKHNYESLSIYWWPDPKNPDGPYIAKDGEYNPEYKKYDYPRLLQLKANLVTCSKAFFFTGDQRYYDYFCRQLDAWFIDPETRMTPNLEYSQFVPGHNNNHGNPQGMSDSYNFNDVLESIRLVNSIESIGKVRMNALKSWFSDLAEWMQTSEYGKKTQSFKNGQLLTFDTTLYNIFVFTGQKKARKAILKAFPEKRVNQHIADDGKMPEELRRTKGFSYSVSALERYSDFASLVAADGKRLPKESVERIRKAFDYISSFADNRSAFPYSEIGDWDEGTKRLDKVKKRFKAFSR